MVEGEETAADELLASAAAQGIHRLPIPTPFAVGRVNVYVIDDDPLTLVDVGPNSGVSLDELERGLESLGHSLESIELILLTHQHIDHLGLVGIVARRSGAEVAAIDAAVPYVQDYPSAARAEDEFAQRVMLRHGIGEDVVRALRVVSEAFHGWGASAAITRVLHDGDRIELAGRVLEVAFRPGHSPSDTVFVDGERRILFAGDHLLRDISSNPLIVSDPRGGDDARLPSLLLYLDSLQATQALDVDLVLPGHGAPVTGHRRLIDERLEGHDRRADQIASLVAERARTAHEVAQAIWGDIAVTQAYLTLSEVLGHTDLLIERGRLRAVEDYGVVRFEAT